MRLLFALTLVLGACGPAGVRPMAIDALVAGRASPIDVRLPADHGSVAPRHSAYGANLSPPIAWDPVGGAAVYAVVVEDPDAHGFVHWLIWNVTATSLPEGVPSPGAPGAPAGAVQGATGAGGAGYFGPRPPSGVHHYHFQVFALNRALSLAPGSDITAFEKAAAGHVIAKGELVTTYSAPRRS